MGAELLLFGQPRIKRGNQEIALRMTKSTWLLIYLACKKTWISRDELIDIFYSDIESQKRNNLRALIHKVKNSGWFDGLKTTGEMMRFDILTDISLFNEAIIKGDITTALSIYQADFLDSLMPDDIPGLDDWLEIERYNLRKIWSENAIVFARSLEKNGKMQQAFSLIEKIYAINPLAEDVLEDYLRTGYLIGHQQKVLDAFTTFSRTLRDEFNLEPLEKTKALVKIIRQNDNLPLQNSSKITSIRQISHDNLIGRKNEMQILQNNDKPITFILGEPGIGKTSLLKTVNGTWLYCFESLSNMPYWPIIEYLRTNKEYLNLDNYKDDLSILVPDLFPGHKVSTNDRSIAKIRLLHTLSSILAIDKNVIFDDLQWADSFTLELLVYMAKEGKVKLFATCRSTEINQNLNKIINDLKQNNLTTLINLGPLDQEDTKRLIELTSGDLSDQMAAWIHDYCGGNPLYINQISIKLKESGQLDLQKLPSKINIPTLINDLIKKRVGQLSDIAQRVVHIASVFNADFGADILSLLTGLSEWAVVDAIVETDNLGLTNEKRFVHGLVKQSIYDHLPSTLKKFAHVNIAEKLAHKLTKEEIAEHWLAAGRKDKACELWFGIAEEYIINHFSEQSIQILKQIESNIDGDGLVACLILQAVVFLEYGELKNAQDCLSKVGNYQNINNLYCRFAWFKIKINLIHRLDLQEDIQFYLHKAKNILQNINSSDIKMDYVHKTIASYAENGVVREETNLLINNGKIIEAINILTTELDRLQVIFDNKKQDKKLLIKISNIKGHLAHTYAQLGSYEQAIKLTKDILEDSKKTTDFKYDRRVALYNLAIFLVDSNKLDEAIKVIYQAQRLTRHGIVDYIDNALAIALSGVWIKKKQFKRAFKQAEFALPGSEHPKYKLSVYSELLAALFGLNKAKECQRILEEIASKFLNLENESYKAMFYALMYRYGSNQQTKLAKKELTKINYSTLSKYAQEYIEEITPTSEIKH